MAPPIAKGGQMIYDSIMVEIEPDLTSDKVHRLDALHPNETEAKKKERMKRYAAAFKKYEERYKEYRQQQTEKLRRFGKGLVQSVERKHSSADAKVMDDLESQMSQL